MNAKARGPASERVAQIRAAHPGSPISRETRWGLLESSRTRAACLEPSSKFFDNERTIRSAVATFRRYQVAGLGAWASGVVAAP